MLLIDGSWNSRTVSAGSSEESGFVKKGSTVLSSTSTTAKPKTSDASWHSLAGRLLISWVWDSPLGDVPKGHRTTKTMKIARTTPTSLRRHNDGLQLRRAISIQAEGTKLLEKHAIAPSAARLCYALAASELTEFLGFNISFNAPNPIRTSSLPAAHPSILQASKLNRRPSFVMFQFS